LFAKAVQIVDASGFVSMHAATNQKLHLVKVMPIVNKIQNSGNVKVALVWMAAAVQIQIAPTKQNRSAISPLISAKNSAVAPTEIAQKSANPSAIPTVANVNQIKVLA
jgi:hypothetical protein